MPLYQTLGIAVKNRRHGKNDDKKMKGRKIRDETLMFYVLLLQSV